LNVGAKPTASGTGIRVRCLYDYSAEDADDLSFEIDDQIDVISKDESGWWKGELNGRVGCFPMNFVEELPSTRAIGDDREELQPFVGTEQHFA